ncbi:MAG TPA: DegT/DnrJ/EryC1/StrS family aminotransferase [bacterium]|nr:DegT/DnrJ/EryC1/StrS family aminotransferase [bacterium]
MEKLAILGGEKAVKNENEEIFKWPIVNKEMEDKVLDVLRAGKMSETDITMEFEKEYANWYGMKYALGTNNGTAALHCAFYGIRIGPGDEVICPSVTYWASCIPVLSLGGTVVFADIDPETLSVDPDDIERKISEKTKCIIVVHYCGYPADMDRIMKIAEKYKLKVVEDCSHSHGSLYKGKLTGTFGDVSAFSIMSGKAFAVGEGGIMLTNNREIYERGIVFGHYERHNELTIDYLKDGAGLPWGGYKYRMHQMSSAVGLVQIKKYKKEMEEIDKAMNYFWDLLEGVAGIRALRPLKNSSLTMGGWYSAKGKYYSEELGGLSITKFCEAARAEGVPLSPGCNKPLHTHPVFQNIDIYNEGKPTIISKAARDVRKLYKSLPISEGINKKVFSVPWFKKFVPEIIEQYAYGIKKVVSNYKELLKYDEGDPEEIGGWSLTFHR